MVLPLMVVIVSITSLYLLNEYLREKEDRENKSFMLDLNDKESMSRILAQVNSTNSQIKSIKYIIFFILLINIISIFKGQIFV